MKEADRVQHELDWIFKRGVEEMVAKEQADTTKRSNPKDIVGSDKVPLHLWPTTATTLGAMALLDGALKYGRSNFRVVGVRASIYYDAVNRHINAWFEGEDDDPDSGLPHLAHALACLAVIVDAQAAGVLRDDRMTPGGYRAWIDGLTPHVRRLKEKHADKSPRHYTREGASGQTPAEKEGTWNDESLRCVGNEPQRDFFSMTPLTNRQAVGSSSSTNRRKKQQDKPAKGDRSK